MVEKEKRFKILVVDDNIKNVQVLGSLLKEYDYLVGFALDGQKAIDLLNQNKDYDLILLDVNMPQMDGFEVCRKIHMNEDLKEIPIIFLTAYNDSENIIAGFNSGGQDYITKPFNNKELLARIHTHLQLKYETELVKNQALELETANKELESFSYSVSHDLRAPLRAINGFSNILLEDYSEKLDEKGQRLLNIVISNAKKMGNLIDDILAFSKINKQQLKKSDIDMKNLINSVYYEVTSEYEREKISFSIADLPEAKGDTSMIRQIWINLLSNAVKFTSKEENPKLEIGYKTEQGNNIYFIKDNGAGFDMNYYDKIFGVFQRLHTEEEYKGTGIGLSIVKSIVTKHGGKIWAESELDVGTTFYFYLE